MNRMKELRTKLGITMKDAAARLHMPYTTYVNYEKGVREANSETLIAIAKFYHVTVDYLIGNTVEEDSTDSPAPEHDILDEYETIRIFAQNLNRLLDQKHITQLALANQMSVAASTVSSWCNAEKMPRMDKIEWMAKFFDVPRSQLIEPYDGNGRPITDKELKFALWGNSSEIDDDDLEDVRQYAAFVKERKKAKK